MTTTPAIGDTVLVRCVVTGIGSMCFSNDPVLDVHLDGREHVSFSCIHGVHTHPLSNSAKEPTNKMTTYTIQRNNKRFNNKKFSRYEEARSYVRTWLRRNKDKFYNLKEPHPDFDYSWNEYRNPEISRYGFSIKRVEAV